MQGFPYMDLAWATQATKPDPEALAEAARKVHAQNYDSEQQQRAAEDAQTARDLQSVEDAPNIFPENEADQASVRGGVVGQAYTNKVFQEPPANPGPQAAIQPPHHDIKRYGEGNIEEATIGRPREMAQAVQQEGQDEAKANEQIAGVYRAEADRQAKFNAVAEAQRQRDLQGFQQRVQALDDQATRIAAHKYDQGTYFRNPGNVLAAIGAALAGMGSGDSTMGYRLITSAIDQDAKQQQQEHENMQADLRGLQTNLGEFRNLMGDRQAGDLMFTAKAKEIAGVKIQEIASQLKSKEAINKASQMQAMLFQSAAMDRANANSTAFDAERARPQGLANAHMHYINGQGGTGVASPTVSQPNVPQPGASVGGSVQEEARRYLERKGQTGAGQKPGNKSGLQQAAQSVVSGNKMTPDQARQATRDYAQNSNLPEWAKKNMSGPTQGEAEEQARSKAFESQTGIPAQEATNAERIALRGVELEARAAAGGNQAEAANPAKFRQEVQKKKQEIFDKTFRPQVDKATERMQKISNQFVPLSIMQKANAELESKYVLRDAEGKPVVDAAGRPRVDVAAINEVMGQDSKELLGPNYLVYLRKKQALLEQKGVPPKVAEEQVKAMQIYASRLQRLINDYGHTEFGGAITDSKSSGSQSEAKRLDTVISQSSGYHNIRGFVNDQSRNLGYQMNQIRSGSDLYPTMIALARLGNISLPKIASSGRPGVQK